MIYWVGITLHVFGHQDSVLWWNNSVFRFLFIRSSGFGLIYPTLYGVFRRYYTSLLSSRKVFSVLLFSIDWVLQFLLIWSSCFGRWNLSPCKGIMQKITKVHENYLITSSDSSPYPYFSIENMLLFFNRLFRLARSRLTSQSDHFFLSRQNFQLFRPVFSF